MAEVFNGGLKGQEASERGSPPLAPDVFLLATLLLVQYY